MKNNPGQPNKLKRRKLLAGVSAGVAGTFIMAPKEWTAPIARSILLPAHAQTSGSNCGDERFTVEDISYGCSTTGRDAIFLEIQIGSDGCAQLRADDNASNADVVFRYEFDGSTEISFSPVEIDSGTRGEVHTLNNCGNVPPSFPATGNFTFDFTARADNSAWRISYDIVLNTAINFVTISNIVVTRQ